MNNIGNISSLLQRTRLYAWDACLGPTFSSSIGSKYLRSENGCSQWKRATCHLLRSSAKPCALRRGKTVVVRPSGRRGRAHTQSRASGRRDDGSGRDPTGGG